MVCEELSKLRIELPSITKSETSEPEVSANDNATPNEIVDEKGVEPASYSPSYTPECSSEIKSDVDDLRQTGSEGVLFRKP